MQELQFLSIEIVLKCYAGKLKWWNTYALDLQQQEILWIYSQQALLGNLTLHTFRNLLLSVSDLYYQLF